jgi:Zn-dependent protease
VSPEPPFGAGPPAVGPTTGTGPPAVGTGPTTPRQHAYRTLPPQSPAPASPPRPAPRPGRILWIVAIVAIVAVLVGAHRITRTEVIFFCVLVPSLILHEISHGVVALFFGDDTAKRAGRISLNPLRHIDAVGTLIVPAITILAGWGFFGWAKPVPVDVRRLRSPRNNGVLVALAGPLTNVMLAAALGVIFYFAYALGHPGGVPASLGATILFEAGAVNLWVAAFNMIPLPPLDGSVLLERLLPTAWWPSYLRIRPYGLIVLVGGVLLLSWVHVYPLASVFDHLVTWWARVVHAS